MSVQNIPFYPSNIPLQKIICDKYITNITKWLLDNPNNDTILARQSNSLWESALSIIFFTEVDKIEGINEELKNSIKYKIPFTVRWLINDAQINFNALEGYVNWENVTWDTAVISRSLLIALHQYEKDDIFTHQEKVKILDISSKSIIWLLKRFTQWDNDIKYPFGPADVSQIIITILYTQNEFPNLSNTIIEVLKGDDILKDFFQNCNDLYDVSEIISKYLLHIKEESYDDKNMLKLCWWDDYFTTSEVLDGLATFYNTCRDKKKYKKVIKEIVKTTISTCAYFENNQTDGMWGSHIDTIKVMHTYISISEMKTLSSQKTLIEPEIHTIFKALRWVCDEKQIFSDGSFMHTMFLSIFYAQALIKVHNTWTHIDKDIFELYDDVIWSSPVRTTPERTQRLSLEMENEDLKLNTKMNEEKLINIFSAFIFVFIMIFFILSLYVLNIIDIKMEINELKGLIGSISLVLTVSGIFITYFNKKLKGTT